MTLKTGFVDGLPRRQTAQRKIGLGIMTIATANIIVFMHGALPENPLPAAMAGLTLPILYVDRRLSVMGKANDASRRGGVLNVQ